MCRLFPNLFPDDGDTTSYKLSHEDLDDAFVYPDEKYDLFVTEEEQMDIDLGIHRFGPFYYSHYGREAFRQVGIELGHIFSLSMTFFPPGFTVHGSFGAGLDTDFPIAFPFASATFEFIAFSVNVRFGGR